MLGFQIVHLHIANAVGRACSLAPSSDGNDILTGLDEALLLAHVDSVLNPLFDILGPVVEASSWNREAC